MNEKQAKLLQAEVLQLSKVQSQLSPLVEQVRALQNEERHLRRSIAKAAFPHPAEGTQYWRIPDTSIKLKLVHKIKRTVDEGALPAVLNKLREMQVNVDNLFLFKPALSTRDYRKLKPDQQAIADLALESKEELPTLEVLFTTEEENEDGY